MVGDGLSGIGGDGHDGEADFEAINGLSELAHGLNFDAVDGLGDHGFVHVEEGYELEAFGGEALIGGECAAEVTHADDEGMGDAVCAEDFFQALDEGNDFVADARSPELAEIGQVFSNLSVGKAERACQSAAGDCGDVSLLEEFELAQIEA